MVGPENLNDHVLALHRQLEGNAEYQSYLAADWDAQAVEGSVVADSLMAAQMVRAFARGTGDHVVARMKLATVAAVLDVVLRRLGIAPSQRRYTVGGEPAEGDDEE
jgi:hypothetical protein